ncbi:oxidoreductase [Nitrospirillum iridis]|uniref:NAD(P)-dependent dehydrogenase (Short-subunit alcohol dehydrogenase family) n=1 Tax=Nitrospirillum iridis TaxID=765888 RepID=A0A7X0AXK5_9PROT|nr:oxidoreductase [Nitrospirillum iridis]MBB6251989.1 NAD(P)-dependent dehydrogenase (short-subunit alcohol dehydrogenase family) [Nitrospirillum iridis]
MTTKRPRTWLITGVSSGFGRALAQAVLDRGERVWGTVRTEADADAFRALAPDLARAPLLDVTDEAAVHRVVAAVEADSGGMGGGGIDVLVNNAGYGLVGGVEETSLADARAQFEVNVFGALAMMQAVLPFMRGRRAGHIVTITSVSGLVGWPSLGIYSGSKFALEGITETLAQEVAPLGIKVTMVEPGGFRTDFAGRSRKRSAADAERAELSADYDATVGACKRLLASHAGHERGDPARAALAILKAVDAETPPLRLLLGEDAVGYATDKLTRQLADIEAWRAVSVDTDFLS